MSLEEAIKIFENVNYDNVIVIVSMLLFAKLIHWMYQNRNDIWGGVSDTTVFLAVVAIVIGIVIGCLWFVWKHPALIIIIIFVYLCLEKKPPRKKYRYDSSSSSSNTNDSFSYDPEKSFKERQIKEMIQEIEDLRRERNSIDTGYGLIIPNGLSDEEREYNVRRRDKLDEEIKEKEWQLSRMKEELER